MSVTASGLADFPLGAPSFPVVLDIGLHRLRDRALELEEPCPLIRERQLQESGGLRMNELTWIDLPTADA